MTLAELTHLAELIAAIGTIIGGMITLIYSPKLRQAIRAGGALKALIEAELTPNGGGSLIDVVRTVDARTEAIEARQLARVEDWNKRHAEVVEQLSELKTTTEQQHAENVSRLAGIERRQERMEVVQALGARVVRVIYQGLPEAQQTEVEGVLADHPDIVADIIARQPPPQG